jgi:hypothetical protein
MATAIGGSIDQLLPTMLAVLLRWLAPGLALRLVGPTSLLKIAVGKSTIGNVPAARTIDAFAAAVRRISPQAQGIVPIGLKCCPQRLPQRQ